MSAVSPPHRPYTCVILAMSADGKIADAARSPARFGSAADKAHLERQISQVDGVLFGAGMLRAYGTTLSVSQPDLLQQRRQRQQAAQPVQIVCSASGDLDPNWRFFQQPVPRWLLTTETGADPWRQFSGFDRIFTAAMTQDGLDWPATLAALLPFGIRQLAVLGGGEIVASLLAADLIDELWLTVCPLLLGGQTAPTPVDGSGWPESLAPRLKLCSVHTEGDEVFLHYCLRPSGN